MSNCLFTSKFIELTDKDLAWRKKEVSDLYLLFKNNPQTAVVGKSILLLLYAHWEGYVKNIGTAYIDFLNQLKVPAKSLTVNLQAIALQSLINKCLESKKSINPTTEFLKKKEHILAKTFKVRLPHKNQLGRSNNIIDTGHNLNVASFNKIADIIGIPYLCTDTMQKLIDNDLLASRNAIAHGSKIEDDNDIPLSLESIKTLKDEIFELLDQFKENITELAENKGFYAESN